MFAAAPAVAGGSAPASTLWWDGFTIAQNISDEDAEATFQAMMMGVSLDMAKANADKANWLIDGATPQPAGVGVVATARNGAAPYPMLPYMGTMHGAIGAEISDFLQGNESAEQALADIEAAYTAAAKEKGFLWEPLTPGSAYALSAGSSFTYLSGESAACRIVRSSALSGHLRWR